MSWLANILTTIMIAKLRHKNIGRHFDVLAIQFFVKNHQGQLSTPIVNTNCH